MAKIGKLKEKLNRIPIPNDIRIDELKVLAEHYGCITESGGRHPLKIIHRESGRVIPIPGHGDTVAEVYIKQAKALFLEIERGEER